MSGNENVSPAGDPGEGVEGVYKRDSVWHSASETCKFLREIMFDKSLVVRDEDKFSNRILSTLLLVGIMLIVVAAFMQDWGWLRTRLGAGGFTPFRPLNLALLGAVDILYFIPLCWFVLGRVGILRTLPKRHALICCQLMIGASMITALVCVNIAMIILLVCLGNNMRMLVG